MRLLDAGIIALTIIGGVLAFIGIVILYVIASALPIILVVWAVVYVLQYYNVF